MDSYAFGLTNAPATFQRTMDMTFSDMIEYTDIYVDDIVVYSESLDVVFIMGRKGIRPVPEKLQTISDWP